MQNNDQRRTLKNTTVIFITLILAVSILIFTDFSKNRTKVYDCRDAHWHPDIPIEVKKECAKLFYENWKKEQDERKNDPGVHENRRDILRT